MRSPTSYPHLANVFSKAYAEQHDLPTTLEIVDKYQANLTTRGKYALPPHLIVTHVARHFYIRSTKIYQPNRHPTVRDARWVAILILRQLGWSTPEIGSHLGGRHHSTILHALKRLQGRPDLQEIASIVLTQCEGVSQVDNDSSR